MPELAPQNHPLKGRKCTPWDGGTRVAALVTGGLIPAHLRGSSNSDLLHVSGQQMVAVPSRSKGSLPGSGEKVVYTLTASPQMGGAIHGSVTFTAPDGRYLWYTVELRAEPSL